MSSLPESVNFTALKQAISMSRVLERYGLLHQLRRSRDNLSGPCPLHAGHNPTQFRVSLSKNCWICFGDCQAGGSILDFVSRKEGVTIRDAALLLQEWFGFPTPTRSTSKPQPPEPRSPHTEQKLCNPPLRLQLRDLVANHLYLAQRGLTQATIETFGLGFCTHGSMAGRIVIPIHKHEGTLVAYAGRWPGDPPLGTPKYKLPTGFRKSLELFNLHRALAAKTEPSVKIVEGFFGCMALWQAGFHRVVALMGSSISNEQRQLIVDAAQPAGRVDLIFDEDTAGRIGREKAENLLSSTVKVRVIRFSAEGLQPDRVPPETLRALLA